MKAYLMYKDKNLVINLDKAFNQEVTIRDMEIQEIIQIMSSRDELIRNVCNYAFLNPLTDMESILYRQGIMQDVLDRQDVVLGLYKSVTEMQSEIKKHYFGMNSQNLRNVYTSSIEHVSSYILGLKELRKISDESKGLFKSEGFVNFFNEIQKELDDKYLRELDLFVQELKSTDVYRISVDFGSHLEGVNYTLRRQKKQSFSLKGFLRSQSIKLKEDDEAGRKDFDYRKDLAINEASNALARSVDHLDRFFTSLQSELAFYVGALNLVTYLTKIGMPVCIPHPMEKEKFNRSYKDLYDVALAIRKRGKVDGNELAANDVRLYLISGANQGGKTTFLRSLGQAQIMGQLGLIVGASEFNFPIRNHIYTHFKKEEDKNIKSGKLDEELLRMSQLIDHMDKYSLVLFNESFSSTNEREGSRINKDICDALITHDTEVFSVTHLYTFSSSYLENDKVMFLLAERKEDGSRTHHLVKGVPEKTAYGIDLYKAVFN